MLLVTVFTTSNNGVFNRQLLNLTSASDLLPAIYQTTNLKC